MPLILLALSIAMLGIPAWFHEEQVFLTQTEVQSLVHYLSLFSSALERHAVLYPTQMGKILADQVASSLPLGVVQRNDIWGYVDGSDRYTVFETPLPEVGARLQDSYTYPTDFKTDKNGATFVAKRQVGFARKQQFYGIYKDVRLGSHIGKLLPAAIPEGALVIIH